MIISIKNHGEVIFVHSECKESNSGNTGNHDNNVNNKIPWEVTLSVWIVFDVFWIS